MHRRSLLALVLGLCALGALAFWQVEREAHGERPGEEALFPGLEAGRVERIRIDHSANDEVIVLARAEGGDGWRLLEPLEYPAEGGVVAHLVALAREDRFTPAPAGQTRDLEALGLAPPRAVVRLEERLADGSPRTHEVELGRLDPDGERVLVRTRGRVGATSRNLLTAADRFLADYRSRAIVNVPPRSVIEVLRRGIDPRDGRVLDARLLLDVGGWWLASPLRARLDPRAAQLVVGVLAGLSAEGFLDDPRRTPADFGFGSDSPRLELSTAEGETLAVELARGPDGGWLARRPGEPWIWRVDPSAVGLLLGEPAGWIDPALIHARRSELEGLELARDGERILVRSVEGRAGTRAGAGAGRFEVQVDGRWRAANAAAVADLLARVERASFGGLLLGEPPGLDPRRRSLRLVLRGGGEQALVLGASRPSTEAGLASVRELVRTQDGVLGWVDPELETLFETSALELVDARLLPAVEEATTRRLLLSDATRARAYERLDDGRWVGEDGQGTADELSGVLDGLFFLKAQRRLPPQARPALEDAVAVRFVDLEGVERGFTIGRAPSPAGEPRIEIEIGLEDAARAAGPPERALADRPELHDALRALLAP